MPPKQHKTVEGFLTELDPSLKPTLLALRALILGVDPAIQEGIKWNCLSFYTREYFAALNVHRVKGRPCVLLVLHTGAKARQTGAFEVPDPQGLLEWLGPDRASLRLFGADELPVAALRDIVGAWISQL